MKDLKLPDNFADAKVFQDLFITPLLKTQEESNQRHLDELKKIVAPVVEATQKFEGRLSKLEKDQKKALLGWGVYATAIGIGCTAAWKWISSKIHFT
jgi:hypothetical protein